MTVCYGPGLSIMYWQIIAVVINHVVTVNPMSRFGMVIVGPNDLVLGQWTI